MKRRTAVFIATAALSGAVLVSAALGDNSAPSTRPPSKGALVALGETTLGKVLVDARGRTLYLFEQDKRGKSACYGVCATYWPPLYSTATPRPGRGVHASLLGSSKRTDGKRQVTYAGHPLYTFSLDKRPGQTTGEGLTNFGGTWDAVAASGRAVESTSESDGSGGYGDGYDGYGPGR